MTHPLHARAREVRSLFYLVPLVSAMRQRELKLFRRLLEERKRDILTEAERALDAMNSHHDEALADPTDRAALESDRSFSLRLRDRERKLLGKIDEAFAR